jgi:hypothetical protein
VLGLGKFQNGRPGAPPPTRSAAEQIERYRWFAEEIMPRARRIVPATAEPDAADGPGDPRRPTRP